VEVPGPRKSVGAEVNYGIRFREHEHAVAFISELAGEVEKRMNIANARGRTVTLKLKRCAVSAFEPVSQL
jgi:DNA repair protein REV1